ARGRAHAEEEDDGGGDELPRQGEPGQRPEQQQPYERTGGARRERRVPPAEPRRKDGRQREDEAAGPGLARVAHGRAIIPRVLTASAAAPRDPGAPRAASPSG